MVSNCLRCQIVLVSNCPGTDLTYHYQKVLLHLHLYLFMYFYFYIESVFLYISAIVKHTRKSLLLLHTITRRSACLLHVIRGNEYFSNSLHFSDPILCISWLWIYVFLFFFSVYYAGVGQSCVHLCITCAASYHGIALDGENTVGRSNKMQWWSHILHNTTDTLTLL